MRVVKFRVWHNGLKKMAFFANPHVVTDSPSTTLQLYWDDEGDYYHSEFDTYPGDEVLVSQFTGLLDINKKEIYEGDILQSKGFDFMEISWSEENAGFYFATRDAGAIQFDKDQASISTVIGNVYEQSELINK